MKFVELATALTCAVTAAVAAPPHARGTEQGFSIAQNTRTRLTAKDGAVAYKNAIRKFGGQIPAFVDSAQADITSSKAEGGSGTVGSDNEPNDSQYLTPVKVGDSVLNLDLDTGSSDLWVYSDLLPANQQAGHDVYKTKNNAFTGTLAQGSSWEIQYGDDSTAEGPVYTDQVTLAGLTVSKQAVEAAAHTTGFQSDRESDGIFGFAYGKLNTIRPTPQPTWFDNVKGSLQQPLFAAALKYHAPGYYDFGYINSSRYTGEIAYRPVDQSLGFWQIHCGGYYVGNTAGQRNAPASFNAIVDTGTSLVLAPMDLVNDYYAGVQSATFSEYTGGVVFSCSETLPDLSFVIDGQKRTAPGRYFNYATVPGTPGYCFGGIQPSDGLPFAVIGDTFLKSQYVVFDGGNNRVGFAQASS